MREIWGDAHLPLCEDLVRLFEAALDLLGHGEELLGRLGEFVQGRAEVGGDLRDLVAHHLSREESHKEDLVDWLGRPLGVDVEELLRDGLDLEDGVAARRAEEHALERSGLVSFDHTTHLPEEARGGLTKLRERH